MSLATHMRYQYQFDEGLEFLEPRVQVELGLVRDRTVAKNAQFKLNWGPVLVELCVANAPDHNTYYFIHQNNNPIPLGHTLNIILAHQFNPDTGAY